MSRRRNRELESELPLPWQIEVLLWVAGLFLALIPVALLVWQITSSGRVIAEFTGGSLNSGTILKEFWFLIVPFWALSGMKIAGGLRRLLARKICGGTVRENAAREVNRRSTRLMLLDFGHSGQCS